MFLLLQDFTLNDYRFILNSIKDEYGDPNVSNIYLYPHDKNNLGLAWTNASSLADEKCNLSFLKRQEKILINEDDTIRKSFKLKSV